MQRVKKVLSNYRRVCFALGLSLLCGVFASSPELHVTPASEPVVLSIAGTKYQTVKLLPANRNLPNATVHASLIDSPDDGFDAKVNGSITAKIDAFIRSLPPEPAVAGFYHQLRITPRVDYSNSIVSSVTLQIDEYHPIGKVSMNFESWTADGSTAAQPVMDQKLSDELASALHIPQTDLSTHLGSPLAMGLLPNYKARLYASGALSGKFSGPYLDVPLAKLPDLTERYQKQYYAHYPAVPSSDEQAKLDLGFDRAVARSTGPADCERDSCVALTFDDGPDAEITPQVLRELAEAQVKATFFVQGNQVHKTPGMVRQAAEEGHEVENHTYAHPDLVKLHRPELIRKQIDDTQALLAANGVQAKFLRPPYGSVDDNLKAVANMPLILWNVDAQEWRPGASPQGIASAIVTETRPGSIILLHDTRRISADALPLIIDQLKARGFRFVTVAELLKIDGLARGVFASR